MNYKETINYLFNKLPMFSRMGSAAFKKDLTNTLVLCEHLDNPQKKFKSIHVAGTNGKGSVSHMLAAILQKNGYKTGLYTSPHLKDFRERIKINGEMITEEFVINFTEKIKPKIEELEPSFFEITVAMAFEYFAKEKIDIAVIEVGLGGRLDSTNIITPELSVITNIGYDHMNMLGNSLEEIATEKAGIIKENIPVVIGEKNTATEKIFRDTAKKKNAPIFFAEENFGITASVLTVDHLDIAVQHPENEIINYQLDLNGIYQTKNLLTVLQAVKILGLNDFRIKKYFAVEALKNVKKTTGLNGRWQIIKKNPTVVLEVAHNEDGINQMMLHLSHLPYKQLHFILGMVKDKEVEKVLQLFPSNAKYYFTQSAIPRALPAQNLQEAAKKNNLIGEVFNDVNIALQNAIQNSREEDVIIVCGSIFLVAEVNESEI